MSDETNDLSPTASNASAEDQTQSDPGFPRWWQNAIFYQIYPRSFSDDNGDGVGDIPGVIDKLGYLELVGVDAIWLSPVMKSPMADHGYDVSDPRDIDELFGGLEAIDALIREAHDRDIKVTMDLVPNHTSDQHPWFVEALGSEPGGAARDRYIFRDGLGDDGSLPPNNWASVFGGPAWTRITDANGNPGQWYLHIFAKEQPDLNWDNPEVFADLEKTLRFWLDRGVDGFRIDVAHGMAKPEGLPDMDLENVGLLSNDDNDPRFNNPGVHDIHRKIRAVLDDYPDAMTVGEIWVEDNVRFAEYVRPDELHLGFNFRLAKIPFDSEAVRGAIEHSLEAIASVSGTPTWTLSNHDVEREVTRYATEDSPQAGVDRARAMILVELALPGAVFIYNGAELGLPNADLPDDVLQDPVWERTGHTERGRDGCRVPLPWEGTAPPFAFSSNADTWLPIPAEWAALTVENQLEDVNSTLSLYRQAIEFRKTRPEFAGEAIEWYGAPAGCLAFRRSLGKLVCALNAGSEPIGLPPGELLLSSAPLVDGKLPPNAAAWLV
ncbi:glycoside hydrolase family 13 protein [Williamsia sp.]|uniref:glycoside hydrolase family 13 protein n=1 Tax=Williamsia sp. TaxID=1872085 RepID=UPI002F9404EB